MVKGGRKPKKVSSYQVVMQDLQVQKELLELEISQIDKAIEYMKKFITEMEVNNVVQA